MDASILVGLQNAQTRLLLCGNRIDGDSNVGFVRRVDANEFSVIHPVEMIAGEDDDIMRAEDLELEELLAQRIRCT